MGFLNDLILITASVDQNFSAIAPGFALLFKTIRPFGGIVPAGATRLPVHS
ncbi:hypothetical protein LFL96_18810 [Paraburkholderia sp. D15]|uniref:hypothetical protein n=1 Tax=Paraburkholderia sp. D15 TaxID=2880218 RepID=UPI0024798B54|nr:hypothetical protein [Paraburkholderia sp. D15]WGS49772.1 hypothetical protein LFL96_18810 [Paraburkholderia sp. D15]